MNLATVEHLGHSYQGKWLGTPEVPSPDQEVEGILGNQRAPGKVVGYFVENDFLGCQVELLRLPERLHELKIIPTGSEIKGTGTFSEHATKDDAFRVYLFGTELKDPQPRKFPGHDALEEFAVLVAAASYGRNTWRDKLDECWMNGSYWKHSYSWFSGELQRVRNGDGKAFVEYAVSRNQKWIEQARRALQ